MIVHLGSGSKRMRAVLADIGRDGRRERNGAITIEVGRHVLSELAYYNLIMELKQPLNIDSGSVFCKIQLAGPPERAISQPSTLKSHRKVCNNLPSRPLSLQHANNPKGTRMKATDQRKPAQAVSSRRQDVLAAVEAFESRLTRFALRLTGDLDLARDAVQHTFVQLCDEPPRSSSELAAWLFTVCRNKAFDHLRRGQRDESLNGLAAGELLTSREPDPAEAGAPWLLDPAVAADRLRAAGEDEDLLRRIDVAAPSRCARDERRTTSSGEAVVFAERCRAPFEGR